MKKIVSLILVLSMCLALSSCALDFGDLFGSVDPQDYSLASAAQAVKVGYSEAREESYVAFIEKLDAFAAKLTYEVYADSDKRTNVCISPVSVYMALALATECSSGETRDEILSAVGVTYSEVKSFTKTLYSLSNREFYYYNAVGEKKVNAFEELANSIWINKNSTFKEEGINNLANNFNCDLFSVDFESNEGERAVSAYIKEKTHGIIDTDVDLHPETLITIINTFYLKEVWNEHGDKLKFTDESYNFENADGSVTNTKLLKGYYFNGKVYEGDGYTSFYTKTDHGFEIKFIVPTDGQHTLEEVFTEDNIYNINNLGDYGYVDDENRQLHYTRVFFPEYTASYDGNLAKILKDDFGINDLFDIERCDFSNVTDELIFVDGVIHKCSLDVNARGIEGAAVTAMPGAGASGPPEYEEVYHDYIVDRAFGFVITDSYGAVIFSGVVNSVK